ncbi:hypothetical protein BJV82DRAFT_672201 [Fennellomyces sp. T-0311]|nr:hypothetical protein BJV82DRAFT_672201 [Fennellomyces sp. T-0311]
MTLSSTRTQGSIISSASSASSGGSIHHATLIKSDGYSPSLTAFYQKPHDNTPRSSSDIVSDVASDLDYSMYRTHSLPEIRPVGRQQHVVHSGEVMLHEKPDSGKLQLLPMKKSKRVYLVLTDTCLLQFKSSAKARTTDLGKVASKDALLQLNSIFAVHVLTTASESHTLRIEYIIDDQRTSAILIQVDSVHALKEWTALLRKSIRQISSTFLLSASERYSAIDRVKKQNDVQEDMAFFKIVFKEKRRQSTNDLVPKEVHVTVILAIGKYSFYLLPSASGALIHSAQENDKKRSTTGPALERDRYGLLAVSHIEYENADDTFKVWVRQIGKPNLPLSLASTWCEQIIQKLRQAIDSLAPIRCTYTLRLPDHLQQSAVVPLTCASSYFHQAKVAKDAQSDDPDFDEQFLQFELVLHAHCAALNLNKARLFYDVSGPMDAKRLVLLPPNAINQSADTYSKYELIALLRSVWHNPFFQQVNFSHHSLEELDKRPEQDGWSRHPRSNKSYTILANELYAILIDTPTLRKIDLTDCHIGTNQSSSWTFLGTALQEKDIPLDQIAIGKNAMSSIDIQEFVNGLHVSKGLSHLDMHDMNLNARQMEQVISTLLSYAPERLTFLDVSYATSMPSVSPGLVEAILIRCTHLRVLRLGGHCGLKFGELLFKREAPLTELDMSNIQHTDDDVLQLTQWIRSSQERRVLGLNSCGLHGGHLRTIMEAISQSTNTHLSFSGNPVLKDVVYLPKLFPVFMQATRGPTSLALGRIEWEESTIRELFDCLRDNQTLIRLDMAESGFVLGTDQLSYDTVRVLTRLLERNATLKELSFKSSAPLLGKAITQALVGLKLNRSLERLDLTNLSMGDPGAEALADALQRNKTLHSIEIDGNKISIQGFRALSGALSKSTVIELSRPYKDLRYQLQTLRETIAGLIQSENEMQWFIIHSTQASETKRTRAQLQMQNQARRSAESSYSKITGVVNKMMQMVEENHKQYSVEQRHARTLQLHAEYAAEELAIAQLRLQSDQAHHFYQPSPRHITQSPLPSPPPPWATSSSTPTSSSRYRENSIANIPDYSSYSPGGSAIRRSSTLSSSDSYSFHSSSMESPTRPPPRRRYATSPSISEHEFDHPGFTDDFGIIVRQELITRPTDP